MSNYTRVLYSMLFELSRSYQSKCNLEKTPLYQEITNSIENTPKLFPQAPMVACQGVEGAYAQIACEKIFKSPFIMYFKNFEGVFNAIEKGLCQYGILPIENSTAGSVKKVYDLMIRHNFSIVRSFRLKIDHNLLALPGAKLEDVHEVYSHEQAINQCSEFLQKFSDIKIIPVENTAVAVTCHKHLVTPFGQGGKPRKYTAGTAVDQKERARRAPKLGGGLHGAFYNAVGVVQVVGTVYLGNILFRRQGREKRCVTLVARHMKPGLAALCIGFHKINNGCVHKIIPRRQSGALRHIQCVF